ncbi:MAG TPA: TonB-dependent siderophore receptor [Opitutaceae bacterium]
MKSVPVASPLPEETSASPVRPTVAALSALVAAAQGLAPHAHGALAAVNDADPVNLPQVDVESQREKTLLSSPKFTAPLVDTPQTIAVVPKEIFTQQSAVTLSDVLRNTPGITFSAGEGGNVASGDSFYMRGFDTSGSIFVDGVRDTGGYFRDIYNTEQVEIAKGPAGADSGRGGSSGYVNLVTKTPQLASFQNATLSYGSEEQKRATIDVNDAFTSDALSLRGAAVRLNAMWQDGGVAGRDYVENQGWAVAPSLALGLGTPTRVTVAASITKQDNLPDSGLPIVAAPGGIAGPVDQDNYYGLVDEDYEHVTAKSATAKIEHDFAPDVKLVNQTRIAKTDRDAVTTYFQNSSSYVPATGMVTPRRIHTETENEILANQTHLGAAVTTGNIQHALGAGLELSREEQYAPTWTAVTAGPATNIHAPDVHRPVDPAAHVPTRAPNQPYSEAKIETAALYGFDTVKLHEKFSVTGSVRLERYDADYRSLAAATTAAPNPEPVNLKTDDDLFSWKAGAVYKPAPNGSIYAAYGNSLTPPGSGFTLSESVSNQNNPIFDPQESRNYEVGAKWDLLKGRLSTSLALYRSENENVVTQDSTTLEYVQDASQTVEGVEFGISGKIAPEWLVFGGLGYMDTEYTAPASTSGGSNDGAALRFAPKLSGNLWTTYALPFGLTIGGGAQYSDSVVRSTSNTAAPTATAALEAPDYWVFNAMAAYSVNKHVTVRLNVNNVFDEEYHRLNNNGGRYYPGTPRSFILTADLRF